MLIDFILVLFIVKEGNIVIEKEEKKNKEKLSYFSVFTSMIVSMLLVLLLLRIGRSIFNPFMPIYVQEILGTTEGTAKVTGTINGLIGLVTAISGLTLSRLGDKYDRIKLLMVLLIVGVILSIPIALINNLWTFAAFYCVLFFVIGGTEPIIMSITTEETPRERRGMLFGIQGTVGSIGFALTPLIGGIVSIKYSTKAVIWLIPIFLMLSIIAILVLLNHKRSFYKDEKKRRVKIVSK